MLAKIFCLCFLFVALAHAQSKVDVLIIDPFSPNTDVIVVLISANSTFPIVESAFTQSASILGGERDLILQVTSGAVGRVISTGVANGTWDVSAPSEANSVATMQYDGVDGSNNLNTRGLVGIDFGQQNADSFRLSIITDIQTTYTLNVFGQTGGQSTFNLAVNPSSAFKTYFANFNQFTGNADFGNVGAFELVIGGGVNVDTNIDLVTLSASTSPSSNTPSISKTPHPTKSPVVVGFTWYNVDDDFGREPCEEEPQPKPYFVSEQNIIYYYFYRAYYEPVLYLNSAATFAPYLIGTVAALILAIF